MAKGSVVVGAVGATLPGASCTNSEQSWGHPWQSWSAVWGFRLGNYDVASSDPGKEGGAKARLLGEATG